MSDEPPIPRTALRDLFATLDEVSGNGYKCDHTYSMTKKFLKERKFQFEPMIEWLGENGAGCDCEVMFNTAQQWAEIVGYEPPDEDE